LLGVVKKNTGGINMKAIKFITLLVIILVLFLFNGCTETISEEQKATEKQIMAFLTSIDKAFSQKDWAEITRIVDQYYAEDILIRYEDPNRKDHEIQILTLQQFRRRLQQAPEVIFDYKHKFKNRKIEVAPDGKSAKVNAGRVGTTTMDKGVVVTFAPYLFKDKNMASNEPHVTIKDERQITIMFEYREGKLLVTQIDSKVIKRELI
jgi:hypothetical protein